MFNSIDLQKKLLQEKNKELKGKDILQWVNTIFDDVSKQHELTRDELKTSSKRDFNLFDSKKIISENIFHVSQIKKICADYRLRFLDTKYFKGEFPEEAISKIHLLEYEHQTKLGSFKIMAPSVLFRLKKADDPILFAPIGNEYYYLIHKWGNDLHPLRKLKYWSIKNIENFIKTLVAVSFILTLITHSFFFREHSSIGYFLLLFMFYFKGAVGLGLMYGIASGKNFSEYAWNSRFNKIC